MIDSNGIDWEDAFSNGSYVPYRLGFPEIWTIRAAAFRERTPCELDLPYGGHPREMLDLFFPGGNSKGLAVFIHGGYWLDFDKSSWSDLAEGALRRGWTVVMPSYTLAPEASIPDVTRQVSRAIALAADKIEGNIRIAGHSAGGHFATRMICEDTPLPPEVAARVERVVSISGLHDLRPLRLNSMNNQLGLDADTATAESPALDSPFPDIEVTAWVGGRERPEFLKKSALLVENWRLKGLRRRRVVDDDRHHFDVVDGLKDADHPLALAFAGD